MGTRTRKTRSKPSRLAWALAGLLLGGSLGGLAQAHPYHVTIAEATHRPDRGRLEVSLRFTPDDLEAELSRRYQLDAKLDERPYDPSSDVDRAIAKLVQDDFRVLSPSKILYGTKLVGRESNLEYTWLHFEVAVPSRLDELQLFVRVLFSLEAGQENRVNLDLGSSRKTFVFRVGDRPQPLIAQPHASPGSDRR